MGYFGEKLISLECRQLRRRHIAKVFFVSPLWEMWKFSNTQDFRFAFRSCIGYAVRPFIWAVTPYHAECGVYRSLPRKGFHNLPHDKRK